MSERDPHRWSRFATSAVALLALVVVVPVGLIAASRARFGSANPLAGVDPPWTWVSNEVGDALSGPLADDTVTDGIIRLSLCVIWVALAVILVTTVVEIVHAVRHHGLAFPDVRGVGWAQSIARYIAVGLVAVLPMMTSATSLASTLGARAAPTASFAAPVGTVEATAAAATFDRRGDRCAERLPARRAGRCTWSVPASRSTRSPCRSPVAIRVACSRSPTRSSTPTSAP